MSIFTKIWTWLKKEFVSIETHSAHIAVAVSEVAKNALQNGSLDVLAKVADLLTGSNIGDEVEAALKIALPKIIAVSAAIETHPDATWSTSEVQAWEQKLLDAFNIHGNKSVLYTLIAAQIYGVINSLKQNPGKPNFATWVGAVEKVYEFWEEDQKTIVS